MKIICAWCQKVLEKGDGNDNQASHGLCQKCKKRELKKLKEELKRRKKL